MKRAHTQTIALLENNWPAVERVAGALQKRDRLEPKELDRLIAGHDRRRKVL
jgi:hypothetical protein